MLSPFEISNYSKHLQIICWRTLYWRPLKTLVSLSLVWDRGSFVDYEDPEAASPAEVGLFVSKLKCTSIVSTRLVDSKSAKNIRWAEDRCEPRQARNKLALLLLSKTVIELIELLQHRRRANCWTVQNNLHLKQQSFVEKSSENILIYCRLQRIRHQFSFVKHSDYFSLSRGQLNWHWKL